MHINNSSELRRRWRRQIAARFYRSPKRWPRQIGALGFLVDGGRISDLVELNRLTIVVVYDEVITPRRTAIRVAGYRATLGSQGVQWGGCENHRLLKDLALLSKPFAKGLRIDSRNTTLLQLALRLDHRIEQALRHRQRVRRHQLALPRLWAGFRATIAERLTGEGAECKALCAKFDMSPKAMLAKFRREQDGLALFPADWVASDLHCATALFAELGALPPRQAFLLEEPPGGLCGCAGVSQFDFYGKRARRRPRRRRADVATPATAAA